MLLKALKLHQPFHFLLIPIIAIILWIKAFMMPQAYPFYPGEDAMILYQPISLLLTNSPLLSTMMAFAFTLLLAFLILKLNVQYTFIRVRSFLPSSVFILLTSGVPALHAMHPIYPAALLLVMAIDRIFNSYEKEVIHSNAFDAGILLSLGSLFYWNLVFFFPLIWFGFIVVKAKVNWREFVLSTIGFAMPWLAAFAYYAAMGAQDELRQTVMANLTFHNSFLKGNLLHQIYTGYVVLLILLGSYYLLSQYDDKRISSRKFFKVFFWVFLISLILLTAHPAVSQEFIIVIAIPLAYLIGNYFIFMKHQLWGEVLMYLLIGMIVYLQFAS
ncbi:MAG: DUF6427 family protein [Methylococcaceae bacterium]|nr:DUF6427 family protein [Prolixibacteraceae bacterium]